MGVNHRIVLVSNRLPVNVRLEKHQIVLDPSLGGVATGLRGPHVASGGPWIGWPGDVSRLDPAQRVTLDERLADGHFVPVHLSASEIDHYYEGFANGVLWPLFHSLLERQPLDARHFDAYRDANARFADAVVAAWRPGDVVWVHDYHLLLLPAMLRERLPDARIGLFLHIPFPASDVFRTLAWKREVLEGMLGADVVGFHTYNDLQNFSSTTLRVLGSEPVVDQLTRGGRSIRLTVAPMSIDFDAFDGAGESAEVRRTLSIGRGRRKVATLLGVDRLDYTKGIPRRILTMGRLFERHPHWRGRVRLIQVAAPSREGVGAYRELRRQVDELVGQTNGRWGTLGWTPVQILHRAYQGEDLVALYRAANVAMVTPLRDGMNLVAKEFVAARRDEDGVLVLSEFAGAAAELGEAIIVNPYDLDGVADAIDRALTMPDDERSSRMRAMRGRVREHDVHAWARGFLGVLEQVAAAPVTRSLAPGRSGSLAAELAASSSLVLLLDHDGTLVELAPTPDAAAPGPSLTTLLRDLAGLHETTVHVISGRSPDSLTRWYGGLPIYLHAEHGALWREPGGDWSGSEATLGPWRSRIYEVMSSFATRTTGAFVEEKSVALAWHYRGADPEFGAVAARELRHHLRGLLASAPVEIIAGNKVIEARPFGVHKGLAARRALASCPEDVRILAIGDDRTDEDLFEAVGAAAVTIVVGDQASHASWRLADPAAVQRLLADILRLRRHHPASSDAG